MIGIVDFGSQYTQLIARRIRELGVKSEIIPYFALNTEKIKNYDALILSGSPASLSEKDFPRMDKKLLNLKIPILGICYGMQLISKIFGGKVEKGNIREYGEENIRIVKKTPLFDGIPQKNKVWMSHFEKVSSPPKGFKITSFSSNNLIASIENEKKKIYGVQFHPEVHHTDYGTKIFKNFLFKIAKVKRDWNLGKFIEEKISEIKKEVGDGKVIMAISGGVDSSVTLALIKKAIGNRIYPVFVNTGLVRDKDIEKIKILKNCIGIRIKVINAKKIFLKKLKGIIDPERKRKIIGREFINVFTNYAQNIKGITHLAQGTLYPDVIESAKIGSGSSKIKTHHNVGGLPEKLKFKLLEPLKFLFKDEVRIVGKKLSLPDEIILDHPFPGPGLAVRIIGEVNEKRLNILKRADRIIEEELKNEKIYYKVWQAFGILLPVKTVGVMGDKRTYENVIALRIVNSLDGMTANFSKIPWKTLNNISKRIVNEVNGVNRVVYDLTNKPPGTIEWE
ncbi:MAG: GMP synthase (glutamine-hydrolyzing) [Caldiserica bacterium]|nr:MAG: GMP synthase (glutamine-hydrolyzing) [Caldisericota bacterium]